MTPHPADSSRDLDRRDPMILGGPHSGERADYSGNDPILCKAVHDRFAVWSIAGPVDPTPPRVARYKRIELRAGDARRTFYVPEEWCRNESSIGSGNDLFDAMERAFEAQRRWEPKV